MESYELAKACAKVLSDKKASDIVILNVGDQTVVCSYFVIATGKSTTQVHSLGDNVDEQIKKLYGLDPIRQGSSTGSIPSVRRASAKAGGAFSITATSSCTSSTRNPASSIIWSGFGIRAPTSNATKIEDGAAPFSLAQMRGCRSFYGRTPLFAAPARGGRKRL